MFKHGKWEIDIDKNRTKEHYDSLPAVNTQSSRNFIKSAESFTTEEKKFFDSFCVDLSKVEVEGDLIVSSYFKKKLYWECSGDFIVFGNIISAPDEEIITIEDVAQNGIEPLENRETDIKIGRFTFYINSESDEDLPEGAIALSLFSNDLSWLLDEKCEETFKTGFNIFDAVKMKLHELFIGRAEEKRYRRETTDRIVEYFNQLGIELVPVAQKEILNYKKEWVRNYTDDPEAAKHSLPSHKEHTLLWHVFSFEEGKAKEGEEANICYDNIKKGKAVIYIDDIDTAFTADNIDNLTSPEIEKMCFDEDLNFGYMDIIVTADDFSWTYCRTHETGWIGPYFYNK